MRLQCWRSRKFSNIFHLDVRIGPGKICHHLQISDNLQELRRFFPAAKKSKNTLSLDFILTWPRKRCGNFYVLRLAKFSPSQKKISIELADQRSFVSFLARISTVKVLRVTRHQICPIERNISDRGGNAVKNENEWKIQHVECSAAVINASHLFRVNEVITDHGRKCAKTLAINLWKNGKRSDGTRARSEIRVTEILVQHSITMHVDHYLPYVGTEWQTQWKTARPLALPKSHEYCNAEKFSHSF